MINFLKLRFSKFDENIKSVAKNSFKSLIVKISVTIVGLFVSIAVARSIGPEGVGLLNLSNRVLEVLIALSLLGMVPVIIKNVAIYKDNKKNDAIGDLLFSSYFIVGVVSFIISLIFILLAPWISSEIFNNEELTSILILYLIALLPQVFTRIFSAGLAGFGKIWQSNLAQEGLSIIYTGFLLLIYALFDLQISLNRVAIFYVVGRFLTTISLGVYFRRVFSFKSKPKNIVKDIFKTSKQFYISNTLLVLSNNIDVIFLGFFVSPFQLGIYGIASRIALLNSFALKILNSAFSPKIASLYANSMEKDLKLLYTKTTKILFFIGVCTLLTMLIFGKQLLMLWGKDFLDGYAYLLIISIGQFVNVVTGSVGQLLDMTGLERVHKKINIFWTVINLVVSFIFIKFYGAMGAAISFSFVLIGTNLTRYYIVKSMRNF